MIPLKVTQVFVINMLRKQSIARDEICMIFLRKNDYENMDI